MADRGSVSAPYFVTRRLIQTAAADWSSFDGWVFASTGKDPINLPLHRFCNLVYYWLTKGVEGNAEALADFDRKLWMPDIGSTKPIPVESPWSAANEQAGLAAFAASIGMGSEGDQGTIGSDEP